MRASRSDRRPRYAWQICSLAAVLLWGAMNLYLGEMLSRHVASDLPPSSAMADGKQNGGPTTTETDTQRHPRVATADAFEDASHVSGGGSRSRMVAVDYSFDRDLAEAALVEHGRDFIFQPLRAYIEGRINDTVPGTIDRGNLDEKRPKIEVGRPAKFYVPLPLRVGSPDDLRMFEYGHRLKSCHDIPAKLPVDRGFGKYVAKNVNNRETFSSGKLDVWEEAKEGCPVNADPFLPWIHDLFPSGDGSVMHFIAQNKRRCNSGKQHWEDIHALEPQVTIMQPVSVRRISDAVARELAPKLWTNDNKTDGTNIRYVLAPHEEADPDAMFTRLICRFRAMDYTRSPPELIVVGESLSTYPYNYEFVNYRKDVGDLSMLTPKGKDNAMFWQSQQRFDCPVPDVGDLRSVIASGRSVLSDGTPSIYVDVVPIRTAPRYGKGMSYFTPDMAGETLEGVSDTFGWGELMTTNIVHVDDDPKRSSGTDNATRRMREGFDPLIFWGRKHVIPEVEASGRWENLPVCKHPGVGYEVVHANSTQEAGAEKSKPHKLIACLWASASFTTRGNAQAVSDTTSRLVEWIEFHLLVGFDHIYVYDNTGAHTDELSLESTLFPRFMDTEVTRVDWPSQVCNNNIPAHENTGERSSQYAAENSCRARYGPYAEWMATFDTDEYMIPMGKYSSMRDVVDDAREAGTQILTFKSTRAVPIHSFMEPFHDHKECGDKSDPGCLRQRNGNLFAEVYNCDFEKPPKPDWAERAKKQLYRPSYVFAHYVHYATVTAGLLQTKDEANHVGEAWYRTFQESRMMDKHTDEVNQAVMLHSKSVVPEYTTEWKERCKKGYVPTHGKKCRVGFPWPQNNEKGPTTETADGFGYNCFTNEKLSEFWIPKLRDAMKKRNLMN